MRLQPEFIMHPTKRIMTFLAAGVCAFGISTQSSDAALPPASLTLFDGINTIFVADGSGFDSNPTLGAITFNGVIGIWDINVSTGLTKPIIGSPSDPQMDLNSIDHSTGPGFLKITFVDYGFTATSGSVVADIGGTQANGNARFRVFQDMNLLTDSGTLTGTPYTSSRSAPLSGLSPYSLTEEVVINHTAAGTTSWDAALSVTPVPEGDAIFAMAGLAIVTGAYALRRRKLATA